MLSTPALYARGPYRVIASEPDPETDRLYVVVDTAGAWLREDVSFDAARTWVDTRVAADMASDLASPDLPGAPVRRR